MEALFNPAFEAHDSDLLTGKMRWNWGFPAFRAQTKGITMKKFSLLVICIMSISTTSFAADLSYEEIAKRYTGSSLNQEGVEAAKMQGECLVGLKELTFKKKNKFDPVAEWTNYRSVSLLEQYSPCEVLIMMEIAQAKLRLSNEKN